MKKASSIKILIFLFLNISLTLGTVCFSLENGNECSGIANNIETPAFENATLGGGCFWCIEAIFQRVPGVINVESGYSGGHVPNPTYQEVKKGLTGHAEVIRVTFDTLLVSYEQILHSFFYAHDPTLLNRQGVDVGHQYRSVIYYHNEAQKRTAEKVIQLFELKSVYSDPIVTELAPLINYYPAEDYHQNYYEIFQENPYVTVDTADITQKIEKFFTKSETKDQDNNKINVHPHKTENPHINIRVTKSSNPFHPWHNISYGIGAPEKVQAFIEIPKGSRAKYEIDKISGYLSLDRILQEQFPYPTNYGFIPQTLYGDGDALDILVFSSVPLNSNSLVQARVIGMLYMMDNNEYDDKILTIADGDSSLSHINDVNDLDEDIIRELKEYFENYKKVENRVVVVKGVGGKEEAVKAIKGGIQLYRDHYIFNN